MIAPSAWVSTIAGSVVSPPQWPECTPPGRRSTTRSKWKVPRVPVAMVGTSGITRGPSLAISTSAASASPLRGDELAQADRAAFLAGLQHQLQVEAELAAALRQHRLQRGQVQRVLALVVGGAAAVPAVAFLGQRPGIEAGAPLVLQPAHGVAVAVGQDGRARRRPRSVRRSGSGRSRSRGLGCTATREAQSLQPGPDRLRPGSAARRPRGPGPARCSGSPPTPPAGRGSRRHRRTPVRARWRPHAMPWCCFLPFTNALLTNAPLTNAQFRNAPLTNAQPNLMGKSVANAA